jgi:FkbM family methyltransferase
MFHGTTNITAWPTHDNELLFMAMNSFAQNQEDIMLWRALGHIRNGFYIDVGAADPVDSSVTKLFYDHGWRGINLEPQPGYFASLSAARPHDINLQLAAGREAASHIFHRIDGTGLSTFDAEIAARHRANGWKVVEETINALPLAEICQLHCPHGPIHFLKVDVEGAESDVLAGADFHRFRPWIVLVEATLPMSQDQSYAGWEPMLTSQGYSFVWFDGLNRFYVANEMKDELGRHFQVQPNVFDGFHPSVHLLQRAERAEQELRHVREQAAETLREAQATSRQAVATVEQLARTADAANQRSAEAIQQLAQTLDEATRRTNAAVAEEARRSDDAQRAARQARDQVAAMLNSTSWRVTAPLRMARRMLPSKQLARRVCHGGARLLLRLPGGQLGVRLVRVIAPRPVEWLARRYRVYEQKSHHAATTASPELREGVLFIGYAEGALGLGQAFRANLKGAEVADFPFAVYPFQGGIETRLIAPYMQHRYDKSHPYKVNVIQVAPDYVPQVINTLGPEMTTRSYNVLCTYWELPKAPKEWREHLANIDEIWAPNKFIADAFAHIFAGPIIIMPPAMEDTGGEHPGRAHFGLEEGRFYFMFSFDYYSSPFRKNPLGVLEAFQRAFPRGSENVGLVIKSTGAPDHYPEIKAVIADAMARDPRILSFDRNMPREEVLGLIRASDSYVSLHRAEGFGLGMAEAMTFGRIVIGTGYSGSTDFLTDETGYPVPFKLRPLDAHEYPWSRGQYWAEPDQEAAVEIMREAVANPTEGKRRGERARDYVLHKYNPAVVGEAMRKRLDVLLAKAETGQIL